MTVLQAISQEVFWMGFASGALLMAFNVLVHLLLKSAED